MKHQVFFAQNVSPQHGISGDKIHPRISATAKRLWLIYFGLTIIETIALSIAGMSFFDELNHSMSNIATGGFSTKNDSLAYWNSIPSIQYIVIFFMILDGTNYLLIYSALIGNFKKIFSDTEFLWYLSFILIFAFIT